MGKRYEKKERRNLINQIKACRQQNMSRQEICDHLNSLGMKMANGNAWGLIGLSGFCNHYRITRNSVRARGPVGAHPSPAKAIEAVRPSSSTLDIVRMILDADLSVDAQRKIIANLTKE